MKRSDRVVVLGGMTPFVGMTGEVVDVEMDGRTKMYRVRLDRAVEVPGVGLVRDDLWAGEYLRKTTRRV